MDWYIPAFLLVLVLIWLRYLTVQIQDVHLSLNSRLDQMKEEIRAASFAAGEKAEQVRQELKQKGGES